MNKNTFNLLKENSTIDKQIEDDTFTIVHVRKFDLEVFYINVIKECLLIIDNKEIEEKLYKHFLE